MVNEIYRRVMRFLAAAVAASLLLSACQRTDAAEELTAVATVYPLTWLVEEIAPNAEVTSLAAQGQDPHDQELSPQERGLFERADLIAYVGDIGFQPQVEAAVPTAAGQVVSVAEAVGGDALRRREDGDAVDPHFWFD